MLLNGTIACTSARVLIPWTGMWTADLELDTAIAPTGRAVFTVGTSTLTGSIDDSASGSFGQTSRVRLVGGLGWTKTVPGLDVQNDAGVLTTAVLSATAAEVQEAVIDALPSVVGTHYARAEGPASSVLDGLEWHVDAAGITMVGPRVPLPAGPGIEVLDWDARDRVAELSSTDLVMPGTMLADTRLGGVATVRDVEQTFVPSGARARVSCVLGAPTATGAAGMKLARALSIFTRESVGAVYLAPHRYRVISQAADRVNLQRVARTPNGPPTFLRSVPVWSGVAATKVQFAPTTIVVVMFLDGDRSLPVVLGADPSTPATSIGVGSPAAAPLALATTVVAAFNVVAANAGLTSATMAAALAPILPTIPTVIVKGS
jgi:hypothetical protein